MELFLVPDLHSAGTFTLHSLRVGSPVRMEEKDPRDC